jgi:hypothetical protein
VIFRDFPSVAVPEDRFEHDPDRDRQTGDVSDSLFPESGKGIKLPFLPGAGIEVTEGIKKVVGHFFPYKSKSRTPIYHEGTKALRNSKELFTGCHSEAKPKNLAVALLETSSGKKPDFSRTSDPSLRSG